MTERNNGASEERRFEDPEAIALSFGHVERRLDDLEAALIGALERIAVAETAEERLRALDELCEALPTMKAHRTAVA